MNPDELHAWCTLWRLPGVGSQTFITILKAFKNESPEYSGDFNSDADQKEAFWEEIQSSPQAFFKASAEQRNQKLRQFYAQQGEKISQLRKDTCEALRDLVSYQKAAEADIRWFEADGAHNILCYGDSLYPPQLQKIPDAPPVLFVNGDVSTLLRGQIAIVGSRQASPPSRQDAAELAQALAKRGCVITSGMALGVDGAAHQACLEAGGSTVAVLGTGVDRIYPPQHRELAYRIREHGALVSDFSIGTNVRAENFPRRNRIISGLSLGVLVVEASLRSGSLSTARHALEQGREVFAIPGSIRDPMKEGCHILIKQGAYLLDDTKDTDYILNNVQHLAHFQRVSLQQNLSHLQHEDTPALSAIADAALVHTAPEPVAANGANAVLLKCMGFEPWTVDALVEESGMSAEVIGTQLTLLELDGVVVSLSGGRFQRLK